MTMRYDMLASVLRRRMDNDKGATTATEQREEGNDGRGGEDTAGD